MEHILNSGVFTTTVSGDRHHNPHLNFPGQKALIQQDNQLKREESNLSDRRTPVVFYLAFEKGFELVYMLKGMMNSCWATTYWVVYEVVTV